MYVYIYIYMYVCMYAYMYVYVYIQTFEHSTVSFLYTFPAYFIFHLDPK